MKKKTARIICLAMAILMALMLALPYVARATAADDVQRLQQELDEVKKKGRELEEKEEQQKAYKANLQKQNDIIQKQIEALGVSIDQTKEALAQKQAELDQKRRDIAETDALFQERLRAMQVNRTSGLLSTLPVSYTHLPGRPRTPAQRPGRPRSGRWPCPPPEKAAG